MHVGGWRGRKVETPSVVSGCSQVPASQDARTWTMGWAANRFPHVVLLLAALAANTPCVHSRATSPRPPYSHPLLTATRPAATRWSENFPLVYPGFWLHRRDLESRRTLGSVTPMGGRPLVRLVDTDGGFHRNSYHDSGHRFRATVFQRPYSMIQTVSATPRFKPPQYDGLHRRPHEPPNHSSHGQVYPRSSRRPRYQRHSEHHQYQEQVEDSTRHSGSEPSDVQLTVTVPTAALRPLLATSSSTNFAFQKRHPDNSGGGPSLTRATLVPGVEIVKFVAEETDDTNTTVIMTLRGVKRPDWVGEESPREKPLSREKRSYPSYGMNSRIRNQMLALRLSISYRHVQPCDYADRFYCMNGGTCVFVGALDIKTCRCPIGYTGVRCELIDQEYILSLLTDSIIFS